VQVRE
jgi:hypothetical protein